MKMARINLKDGINFSKEEVVELLIKSVNDHFRTEVLCKASKTRVNMKALIKKHRWHFPLPN